MKKALKIFGLLTMLLVLMPLTSCKDDDKPDTNYAQAIAGTYTGTLSSEGYVISDTYVVRLERISDTMVTMYANFLSDDYDNFNVSCENKVYSLKSANHSNITITISNKQMTITFLNNAGTTTVFSGKWGR